MVDVPIGSEKLKWGNQKAEIGAQAGPSLPASALRAPPFADERRMKPFFQLTPEHFRPETKDCARDARSLLPAFDFSVISAFHFPNFSFPLSAFPLPPHRFQLSAFTISAFHLAPGPKSDLTCPRKLQA
jgi:hypothetical protein